MKNKVVKACAISDAKIQFVSLVNKAANKKKFLIAKADDDNAVSFQSYGRILKTDKEKHYVTGIVYEPMVEDTQGEYMTADEIVKAAHWFMKNTGEADIQHCFKKADGVEIVESFVAKSDMEISGEAIKEGTWIITAEITNDDVWKSVEKGEITGFSMGGTGKRTITDDEPEKNEVEKSDKKSLFKKLAGAFGYELVEKGVVANKYAYNMRFNALDEAWSAFRSSLNMQGYDFVSNSYKLKEMDEADIREKLNDLNEILLDILLKPSAAENADGDTKNEEKEENVMTKSEVQEIIDASIEKAMSAVTAKLEDVKKSEDGDTPKAALAAPETPEKTEVTPEDVTAAVDAALEKAMAPITEQLEVIKKSRALPSNLNDVPEDVSKSEGEHYLHGII